MSTDALISVDGGQAAFVATALPDPGAVGAGSYWADTSFTPARFYERASDNSDWIARFSPTAVGIGSEAWVAATAVTTGNGSAHAGSSSEAAGDGNAETINDAVVGGTGLARNSAAATSSAGAAGVVSEADATSARMGFNGTTPIARPELPTTPTEQDIADVLVALGLVTQAP